MFFILSFHTNFGGEDTIELGVDPIDFFNKIITEIQNQELIIAVNNFLRRPLDEKKIAAWGYSKLYYPEFEYFEKL